MDDPTPSGVNSQPATGRRGVDAGYPNLVSLEVGVRYQIEDGWLRGIESMTSTVRTPSSLALHVREAWLELCGASQATRRPRLARSVEGNKRLDARSPHCCRGNHRGGLPSFLASTRSASIHPPVHGGPSGSYLSPAPETPTRPRLHGSGIWRQRLDARSPHLGCGFLRVDPVPGAPGTMASTASDRIQSRRHFTTAGVTTGPRNTDAREGDQWFQASGSHVGYSRSQERLMTAAMATDKAVSLSADKSTTTTLAVIHGASITGVER